MRKCAEFQLLIINKLDNWVLNSFVTYYAILVWPWWALCMCSTAHLHQSDIRTSHCSRTYTNLSYINNRDFHVSTICKNKKSSVKCKKLQQQNVFWNLQLIIQHSKLTFSKSCLLATFNCKMVTIKNSVAKKKREGEDTSWHFACRQKERKGGTLHDILHEGLISRTAYFQQFTLLQ